MQSRIWSDEIVLISESDEEEALLRRLYELIPSDDKEPRYGIYGGYPCALYEKGEFPQYEEHVCLGFFPEKG